MVSIPRSPLSVPLIIKFIKLAVNENEFSPKILPLFGTDR